MTHIKRHNKRHVKARRIAKALSGYPLKLATTALAAVVASSLWNTSLTPGAFAEIILVTAVIHALIYLQCGLHDRVRPSADGIVLINNYKSEIKYTLAFIAFVYVADVQFSRPFVITFLVFNTILQAIPVIIQQWIARIVSQRHERELFCNNSASNDMLDVTLSTRDTRRKALIYGAGENGKRVVEMLTDNPESDITPIGFIDCRKKGLWSFRDVALIGGIESLQRTALERQVDLLFMAAEPEDLQDSQRVFEVAEQMGIPVCVLPHIYRTQISACHLERFNGQPALVYSSARPKSVATLAKETVDRLAAAVGLIALSPLLALTAIAVKMTSKGPVLFKQTRLGQNGAPFGVYKFRTMCCDAEKKKEALQQKNEMSGPMFKIKADPRITPLGRVLRKYSVDELPQLINVLKGEMSLVGPRPALPKEVARFSPWQRRKLAVKPGLTCIWQVSGRNNIDFEDWMKLDLEYIDNWSLWLDAKIIARTAPTVLKGTGC